MLLLRYLHVRPSWRWSFSNMVALLRQQIFVYRDLWVLLNQPDQPPVELDEAQLSLAWQGAERRTSWTAGEDRRKTTVEKRAKRKSGT